VNATKHGQRSAKSRAAWRELNGALRAMNRYDREQANTVDGIASAMPAVPSETWIPRIAQELRLSDLLQDLLLARFTRTVTHNNQLDT
jgi:hypothetical protein